MHDEEREDGSSESEDGEPIYVDREAEEEEIEEEEEEGNGNGDEEAVNKVEAGEKDEADNRSPAVKSGTLAGDGGSKVDVVNGDGRSTATDTPGTVETRMPAWRLHLAPRREAIEAQTYDIVPTMAAPQSTSINALAVTPDLRYWLTGGSDGYVRKYDGIGTINGKQQLTVAQRHPFVDSVHKAGILMSYFENEEPRSPGMSSSFQRHGHGEDRIPSPVYSLAVHSQALWLLSGLESGGINLYSVRHDEGKRIHCLRDGGHTSAVSALLLGADEKTVLSGGWDKAVVDWDLDSGKVLRRFEGSGGQIATIEARPEGGAPVLVEADGDDVGSATLRSNSDEVATGFANGNSIPAATEAEHEGGVLGSPGNDHDSLFGSPAGSLFGDGGARLGHDDDDGTRVMGVSTDGRTASRAAGVHDADGVAPNNSAKARCAVADRPAPARVAGPAPHTRDATQTSASTFLSASIDGTLRIWDRRMPSPAARIGNRPGVPPWCMGVCWSPHGNEIFVGRRNGTVEEYSMHAARPCWEPSRVLKLPGGSGAVSAVRPMANGRHIVCASHDILRLYDLGHDAAAAGAKKNAKVPFVIIPGPPKPGVISHLYVDPTSRFMISTAGTRGWDGQSTEVLIGYEINI